MKQKYVAQGAADMQSFIATFGKLKETVVSPEFWLSVGWIVVKIALILIIAKVAVRVANTLVGRVLGHRAVRLDERRSKTLTTLVLNVMRYVVYFFVVLTVLANLGLDVSTLIAGAGVAGLAIGFGAQSLVKDVITGFFIIFEDQMGVGDNVMINMKPELRGNVEEVGLRITRVRAYTGEMHVISNAQIMQVTNYSKTNSLAVVDVSVAYEEDLERVFAVLKDVGYQAKEDLDTIVGEPQVLGVQTFGAHDVVVRMTMDCKPMENFPVARELRKRIKARFDEEGIEIPYPKTVLFGGNVADADNKEQQQKPGSANA
ncbi:MAG: mechanosensitive ion channel family protein [Tumebacillaceae bacterium]